ncbi:MAG: hypothetical protein EGQ82_05750 [Clostridiales bacterium]|nr:hypothetical protein [Clostridiales bacterium]
MIADGGRQLLRVAGKPVGKDLGKQLSEAARGRVRARAALCLNGGERRELRLYLCIQIGKPGAPPHAAHRRHKQPLAEAADAALVREVVAELAVDKKSADPRGIVKLGIPRGDRATRKWMHRAPSGLYNRLDADERRAHEIEKDHVVRQGEA